MLLCMCQSISPCVCSVYICMCVRVIKSEIWQNIAMVPVENTQLLINDIFVVKTAVLVFCVQKTRTAVLSLPLSVCLCLPLSPSLSLSLSMSSAFFSGVAH